MGFCWGAEVGTEMKPLKVGTISYSQEDLTCCGRVCGGHMSD